MSHNATANHAATHAAATHAATAKIVALQAKLAANSHASQNHYQLDAHYQDGTGMMTAKTEIHIGDHVTCNGQETVVYNNDYGFGQEGGFDCQVTYNW